MATVTVGTDPVLLDDGTHAVVYVGNTGDRPALLSTGRTLQPYSSADVRPQGLVLTARTLAGTTTLAVDVTGVFPGTPTPVAGDYADRQLSNLDTVVVARGNLNLGNAATRSVGTTAGTVAAGDDERLTGAREPTAHADSHGDGGTDEVTVAQAQVTGLPAALDGKADLVAGRVPSAQLPSLVIGETFRAANQAAMLALDAEHGDVAVREDLGSRFVLVGNPGTLGDWIELDDTAQVLSVAGKTGVVQLVTADVTGLDGALTGKADTALSNVTPSTGRAALGLGNSSTRNVGTAAGTVAAGDDVRITGAASQEDLDTVQGLAEDAQDTAAAAVPQTWVGTADGVAQLDGAGVILSSQVSGLPPESFGAAPTRHAHILTDLPDVARLLGAALIVVPYDAGAEQWETPARAALGLRPGQLALWFGNAVPPADADADDLHFFDAAAVPLPPVDPPDPPGERDANGVLLGEPGFTVTAQTVNLTALVNTDAARTFTYLQFALRRVSDNTAADTGHRSNLAVNGDYTLTASQTALGAGDWTAFLAYSLDGTTWFNGPPAEFEIEAPAPSPSPVSLIGRSGLPWNAGLFYQAGSRTAADSFATWRNRPLDAIMYFTGRDKWSDLMWFRSDLTSWPGYRIICVPFQPQLRNSQGQLNAEGGINTATASGGNNARWTTWANALKAAGWDDGRTIVRLSWENNGNWYDWAWGHTTHYTSAGAAISAFNGAWINVVNAIRAVCPTVLFDINVNRGNSRSGVNFFTDILVPLSDYFDVVGLDWYNHAPPQLSQPEFDSTAAQTHSGTDIHAWCVANDKLMSLDEWGISHGNPPSYTGGGDDPNWIDKMWVWMQAHAYGNGGRLIHEVTYNDPGAPSALRHSLFNPEQNPNAAARYKQTNRWGRA
jgi:hypothetical protein